MPLDDKEFWAIVDGPEFQRRWRGRAHPLLRDNGGVDFYNVDSLTERLERAEHHRATQPKGGLSGWSRDRYPSVLRDWLKQVEWIAKHGD